MYTLGVIVMTDRKLHPSVQKFKEFVKKHPKLIEEVHGGNKSWQEYYEEWYLFGEEDEMWKKYEPKSKEQKETETKSEFMTTFFSSLKNIDMNQMQEHITNASNVITSIQNVIQQFQGGKSGEQQPQTQNQTSHPFSFRKD